MIPKSFQSRRVRSLQGAKIADANELERQAKDFNDVPRLQMRQESSLPVLEQFH
jgi:hypothetical protein